MGSGFMEEGGCELDVGVREGKGNEGGEGSENGAEDFEEVGSVRGGEVIERARMRVEGWVEDGLPGARGHVWWRYGAVRVAYDDMSEEGELVS